VYFLFNGLDKAVEEINKVSSVRLVSHLDADGISAAAIALSALTRAGKRVHLSIKKQITPEIIEELKKEENELFLFTDLGSGYMELLENLGKACNCKIIVCDHHIPSSKKDSALIQINPVLEGMKEDEISGAGVTYFLANKMNPANKDLIFLAIVGAIGDIQDENWEMNGINENIVKEAVKMGFVRKEKGIRLFGRMNRPVHKALEYSTNPYIPGISGDESAAIQFLSNLGIELKNGETWRTLKDLSNEETKKLATAIICERIREKESCPEEIFGDIYTIKINNERMDAREMATSLNACGRMDQASIGVLSVLGFNSLDKMSGILSGYRKMITKYIKWVKENKEKIQETSYAYYINAGEEIHENFIGTIISICHKSSILNGGKIIFGMAETEDGKIKVSARAPKNLIERGLNLKDMLSELTQDYDGYGGGHVAAAGAFIPKGKEKEFTDSCENYLKGKL